MSYTPTTIESLRARKSNVPQNAGITDPFLNLMAQFKVDTLLAAEKRKIDILAGQQQMPTVKDQVEQSNLMSARQEIAQKMGLPGLQQAAAQPAQPQGQAPQPQAMAGGGLTKLGSNLPKQYAGGGIVAFSGTTDGSYVGDEEDLPLWALALRAQKREKDNAAEIAKRGRLHPEYIAPTASTTADTDMSAYKPRNPVASSPDLTALIAAITGVESGGNPEAVSKQGARGSMQIMPDTFKQYAKPGESYENDAHRRAAAIRKLTDDFNYYGGDIDKTSAAYIGGRGAVRNGVIRDDVRDANGVSPLAYTAMIRNRMGREQPQPRTLVPDESGYTARAADSQQAPAGLPAAAAASPSFRDITEKTLTGMQQQKPEDLRADIDRYFQSGYGKQLADYKAEMAEKIAAIQAAQEAEKKGRPGGLEGLIRDLGHGFAMGQGNFGRSLAFSNIADEKRRQGYAAADQGYAKTMADLHAGMMKPVLEGGLKNFEYGSRAGEDAYANQRAGVQGAASLLKTDEDTKQRLESSRIAADAKIQQAQIHAEEMRQRNTERLSTAQQAQYQRAHDLAMTAATQAATKFANDLVAGTTRPGETEDSVFWRTYNRAMSTQPGFTPIVATAPAAGDLQSAAQAEIDRRKKKG